MMLPVYMNGTWHEDEPPRLPLDDPGVVQGATIVETLRTYGGQVFEPVRHAERLRSSLSLIACQAVPDELDVVALWDELACRVLAERAGDVSLVMLVTPGREQPTVVCHARPLRSYQRWYADGVRLAIPVGHPRAETHRAVKHRSRIDWWAADDWVWRHVSPDAIAWMADADGVLTETAIGNVLVVRDDRLLKAPADRILAGTRAAIAAELAADIGLTVEETPLRLDDLRPTDELWLTSTGCGIAPVSRVDDRRFAGRDRYRAVCAAWFDRFGFDLRAANPEKSSPRGS